MDFRSEVFKLCKAIQKRTETNIVNDTYLRLSLANLKNM